MAPPETKTNYTVNLSKFSTLILVLDLTVSLNRARQDEIPRGQPPRLYRTLEPIIFNFMLKFMTFLMTLSLF